MPFDIGAFFCQERGRINFLIIEYLDNLQINNVLIIWSTFLI